MLPQRLLDMRRQQQISLMREQALSFQLIIGVIPLRVENQLTKNGELDLILFRVTSSHP
jgi:hypothetical protein